MNVADLTVDISQEIEIKAAPGTVYRNMIAQLSSDHGRRWKIDGADDGRMAGRSLVSRPGQRPGSPLGFCAGHQAADAAGNLRADDDVVSGRRSLAGSLRHKLAAARLSL